MTDYMLNERPCKRPFIATTTGYMNNPYDNDDEEFFAFSKASAPSPLIPNPNNAKLTKVSHHGGVKEGAAAARPFEGAKIKMENDKVRAAVNADAAGDRKPDTRNGKNLGKAGAAGKHSPSPSPAPSNKKRTRATPEQLAILEETFLTNTSPNSKVREALAEKVNMSERSIQIWFQNRRAKVKAIQKRAHMLQEETMKAQYLACMPGYGPNLYPFRMPMPQHPQRVPLPRSYSSDMVSTLNQMPVNANIRAPNAGLGINIPQGFWPSGPQTAPLTYGANESGIMGGFPFAQAGAFAGQQQPQSPLRGVSMPTPAGAPKINDQSAMPAQHYNPSQTGQDFTFQNPSVLSGLSCETLTIGTWRRIATTPSDLLVYYSAPQRIFTYFISNNNAGFKMEFPFSSIAAVEFRQVDEAYGEVTVEVKEAPHFFMECSNGDWQMCRDFTEGKQATRALKHVIKGRSQALKAQIMELTQVDPQVGKLVRMMDFASGKHSTSELAPHQTHLRRRSSVPDISSIMQGYRFGDDTMSADPEDQKPGSRHVVKQQDRPRRCSSVPATSYAAPYEGSPVSGVNGTPSPLSINTSTSFLDMFKSNLNMGGHHHLQHGDSASEFSCSSPMDVNTPESSLDMLEGVDMMHSSPMMTPDAYAHHMGLEQQYTSMGISPSLTVSAMPSVTDDEFASMFVNVSGAASGPSSGVQAGMDGSEYLNFNDVPTSAAPGM